MIRRPPRSTRTYTPFPYTTLFRSKRVWKGLYLNNLAIPPVSPEEVAAALKPGAIVSLQSVLGDLVANNPSSVVTAIVPHRKEQPIPSVGEMKTGIGVFRFHAMSEAVFEAGRAGDRSEEHTSELQSLMRISYAVFCLKKKK